MKLNRLQRPTNPLVWTVCESITLLFAGIAVVSWQVITSQLATLTFSPTPAPRQVYHAPAIPKTARITPDYTLPAIENGMVPVISRIPTEQNVVFLTIDDGAYKDPSVASIMKQHHLRASLFLAALFIESEPDFFSQLTAHGSLIENHTLMHDLTMTSDMGYQAQRQEICGMADYVAGHYGRRPSLFRPPGGAYNETTRQAAAACGMSALINWSAKANGGAMQYQEGNELHPGDIVLMHFRPEFAADVQAFIAAKNAAGLHVELLEEWLPVPATDSRPVAGE